MKRFLLAAALIAASSVASAKPQCLALVDLLAMETKYEARQARNEAALPPGAPRIVDQIKRADVLADAANSALVECSVELRHAP